MKRLSSTLRADRIAFTLLEILVTMALAVATFLVVVGLLVRVSGVTQRISVSADLQQTSEMVLARIQNQVQQCDLAGIVRFAEPDVIGLALHPVEQIATNTAKTYAERPILLAWQPTTQTLAEWRGPALSNRFEPHRMTLPEARAALASPPTSILCKCVSRWELSDTNMPLLLRIEFGKNAAGYGWQTVQVERYLNLRIQY